MFSRNTKRALGCWMIGGLLLSCGGHSNQKAETEVSTTEPDTMNETNDSFEAPGVVDTASSTDTVFAPAVVMKKKKKIDKKNSASASSQKCCSVTDSNGPLEGGENITVGCNSDEFCMCQSHAGYSCSGFCTKSNSDAGVSAD